MKNLLLKIFFPLRWSLLILFPFFCFSQQEFAPRFTHYSVYNGLSQNSIRHIFQDSKGIVWILHAEGLDRFDGTNFQKVLGSDGRALSDVNTIFEHPASKQIYIAGLQGIYHLDRFRNRAKLLPDSPKGIVRIDNVPGQFPRLFSIDKEVMFWSESEGRKYPQRHTDFLSEQSTLVPGTQMYLVRSDSLLKQIQFDNQNLVSENTNLREFDSKITTVWYQNNNYFVGFDSLRFEKCSLGSDGRCVRSKLPKTKDGELKYAYSNITALYQKGNRTWIGTERSGLFYQTNTSNAWIHCPNVGGQQINFITGFEDGSIWIGTQTNGFYVYHPQRQPFRHVFKGAENIKDSIYYYSNQVAGIYPRWEDKELLVGTDHGRIAVIDQNTNTIKEWIEPCYTCPPEMIYTMRPFLRKQVLVGTGNGFYIYFPGSPYYRRERELPIDKKVSLLDYNSEKEEIWYSNGSLRSITIQDVKTEPYTFKNTLEFPDNLSFIQSYLKDQFLIGTEKGLYLVSGDLDTTRILDDIHVTHWEFSRDQQSVWVTSDQSGIFQVTFSGPNFEITPYNSSEIKGFPDGRIYTAIDDPFGNVWFSTLAGLYQFNPRTRAINRYTVQNGLPNNEFNYGSVAYNPERSQLFFGGLSGVVQLEPKSMDEQKSSAPFSMLLEYRYPLANDPDGQFTDYIEISDPNIVDSTIITLPDEFSYLELKPTIFDYIAPENQQIELWIDGKKSGKELENGYFLLTNNDLGFLSNTHTVAFRYRTAFTTWQMTEPLQLKRGYFLFPFTTWLLILAASITATVIFFNILRNWRSWRKFQKVQEKINEISRQDKIKPLINLALTHLVEDLNYDFAAISLIDHFERRIKTIDLKAKISLPAEKEQWIENSNYLLDYSDDILVEVAKAQKIVKVVGSKILDEEVEKTATLNPKIFKLFNHKTRTALFVPIIHRSLSEDSEVGRNTEEGQNNSNSIQHKDLPLGVLEVGYGMSWWDRFLNFLSSPFPTFIRNIRSSLDEDRIKLALYTDNFAQPYFRLLQEEQSRELTRAIADDLEFEYDDHRDYLSAVLGKTAQYMNVEFGNIALETYNYRDITVTDEGIFYGYRPGVVTEGLKQNRESKRKKPGITKHVSETGAPYIAPDAESDQYYIPISKLVRSEMGLPMKNEYGQIVGVAVLSSERINFFNKIHIKVADKIFEKAIITFLKKKRYNALKKMVQPYDIFTQNTRQIYNYAVFSLDEYLQAENIIVWKRVSTNKNEFKLWFTSKKDLEEKKQELGFTRFSIKANYDEKNAQPVLVIHSDDIKAGSDGLLRQFAEHFQFQSWIQLSTIIEGKVDAFIYVYSKGRINNLTSYTQTFLEQIVKKTAVAVQGIDLAQSFNDISQSIIDERSDKTLQLIVQRALDLLRADSVSLYRYRKGKVIRLEDGIKIGNFVDGPAHESKRKANLANWVIKNESKYFDNRADYDEFYRQAFHVRENGSVSFWDLHHLKAVAAVKLEHQGRPLGTMFFNYTTIKDFSGGDDKRIIKSFTNLVITTLLNEDYFNEMKLQNEELSQKAETITQQNQLLAKQKQEIQFAYEEVYQKMEEMLPRAAGVSFWMVLQGVNHDVRNFLTRMQNTISVLEDQQYKLNQLSQKQVQKRTEDLNRTIELINNLLTLFDFREGDRQSVIVVRSVIKDLLEFFKHRDDLITFELKPLRIGHPPSLIWNKSEFSMVIYNLLSNAEYAIQKKGETFQGKVIVDAFESEGKCIISVEDDGIGIDNNFLPKIFEIGESTKGDDGLGIGLYFAKMTINKMHGRIEVSSKAKVGTKFTIIIPKRKRI